MSHINQEGGYSLRDLYALGPVSFFSPRKGEVVVTEGEVDSSSVIVS